MAEKSKQEKEKERQARRKRRQERRSIVNVHQRWQLEELERQQKGKKPQWTQPKRGGRQ